jgi:thiol-disulfide isomerase/thioredoxin
MASDRVRVRRAAVAVLTALAACGGGAAVEPTIALARAEEVGRWIADHRGAPLLVNFWASWCQPCLAEMPDLLASTRAFRARGGQVLGVAMELMVEVTDAKGLELARQQARQLGLDFPLLVCTEDMIATRRVIGVELGALPQTLAYDRTGALVQHHPGKATAAQFAELVKAAER